MFILRVWRFPDGDAQWGAGDAMGTESVGSSGKKWQNNGSWRMKVFGGEEKIREGENDRKG